MDFETQEALEDAMRMSANLLVKGRPVRVDVASGRRDDEGFRGGRGRGGGGGGWRGGGGRGGWRKEAVTKPAEG